MASAPAPVPLSADAELERRDQVITALAGLLAAPAETSPAEAAASSASWALSLASTVAARPAQLEAWLVELERLRCATHLNNLDACHSQHRLFSITFAITNDRGLSAEEERLADCSESERQAFFNGVHQRLRAGQVEGFAFTEESYRKALEEECAMRQARGTDAVALLDEIQRLCAPCFEQRSADIAEAVACYPWEVLADTSDVRWHTGTDALTLETPEDLWVMCEAWPSTAKAESPDGGCSEDSQLQRDVLLVVDLSGSMCNMLPVLQECLQDVVAHASDGDRICLVGFNSEPQVFCDWTELGGHDGADARRTLCERIGKMIAKGGTRLVPALQLVSQKLKVRPPSQGQRSTAVVLVSDGDPEEPPEALSSAAARAFSASGTDRPLVVALALGQESRPDLMALLAQCGCGASLFISGREQLPTQLGRMWGILGDLQANRQSRDNVSGRDKTQQTTADIFLILEPAEGVELIETERPPGGVVNLAANDGRRFSVLRCGRHPPPGNTVRLASRLRLPAWAHAPIDRSCLQRPLLRSTWLWRDSSGLVRGASNQLRAVQVPALLIEATTGLPLRVVLAVDSTLCESFERERFVGALADALGVDAKQLSLGRVSPGSIIADLQLVAPTSADADRVRAACTSADAHEICEALVCAGFGAANLAAPGGRALNRVLQWRLAAALEAAASFTSEAHGALSAVAALAESSEVRRYNSNWDPSSNVAAAVSADAARAICILETAESDRATLEAPMLHEFQQQAHAHVQQLCPELSPGAVSVRGYETEPMRKLAVAFGTRASVREDDKPPAAPVVVPSLTRGGSVRIRSGDVGAAAEAIVAFKLSIHHGTRCETKGVVVSAGSAAIESGYEVAIPALEPGAEHAVVCMAFNGRQWGPPSEAVVCRALAGPGAKDLQRSGSFLRNRRTSSVGRLPFAVHVSEASATSVGTLSLGWQVLPAPSVPLRWTVQVEIDGRHDEAAATSRLCAEGLVECRMSFTGVLPGKTYRFLVQAEAPEAIAGDAEKAAPLPKASSFRSGGDVGGLAVQGLRMAAPAQAALPRAAEGLVVVPPFPEGALAALAADPTLRRVGTAMPGAFVRLAGGRARNK